MNGFDLVCYHQTGKDPYSNLQHTHPELCEILQIQTDGGSVLIGGKIYPLCAGDVYFINGAETHCTMPANPQRYVRSKAVLRSDFLNSLLLLTSGGEVGQALFHTAGGCRCPLSAENAAEADRIFLALSQQKLQLPEEGLNAVSLLLRLISLAYSRQETPRVFADERLSLALEYINANLEAELTLEDISRQTHISKYYLCHLFRQSTGLTILEYITERRLSAARRLLATGNLPVTEIATRCGFGSVSYFTQLFKKREGITPSRFRRRLSC